MVYAALCVSIAVSLTNYYLFFSGGISFTRKNANSVSFGTPKKIVPTSRRAGINLGRLGTSYFALLLHRRINVE